MINPHYVKHFFGEETTPTQSTIRTGRFCDTCGWINIGRFRSQQNCDLDVPQGVRFYRSMVTHNMINTTSQHFWIIRHNHKQNKWRRKHLRNVNDLFRQYPLWNIITVWTNLRLRRLRRECLDKLSDNLCWSIQLRDHILSSVTSNFRVS